VGARPRGFVDRRLGVRKKIVEKKELTAIGITCGIGSMLVGARQAGFKVLGNVEWRDYYHKEDERGRNTFLENFSGATFPYNREQMTEDEFRKFSNPDIAFLHPESHPDGLVYTSKGWRMVSSLKVGDLVLTHRGRFRSILKVYRRTPALDTEKITFSRNTRRSGRSIILAGNHPVLMDDESWRKASEVRKGERITYLCERCVKCGELAPIDVDTDTAACYCGLEAYWKTFNTEERREKTQAAREVTRQKITLGTHDFVKGEIRLKGQVVQARRSLAEGAVIDALSDVELERQYPIGPYFVDLAIPNLKIAIEVDGGNWHNTERKKDQDARKELYLKSEGWTVVRVQVRVQRLNSQLTIQGISEGVAEVRRLAMNHRGQYEFASFVVNGLWREKFADGEQLYDLSVDEDNSYVLRGLVVHNCGGYSKLNMVNKNFREKKLDAGDIPLAMDLVAQFKPRFFAMDDLPDSFMAFPMSEYHKRLPHMDLFPEWVSNYHYGNVQKNRKRMFMIGSHKDEKWAFVPGEEENRLTLQDVIEDLGEPRMRGSNIANHDVHTLTAVSPRGQHLDTLGRGRDATYADLRDWFLSNPEGTILRYIASDGTVKVKPSHATPYWKGHAHVLDGASLHVHPRRGTPFTIRERARIQGFPDDFIFYGTRYEPDGTYSHEANNHLVKQTGKAMPVQFNRYVAEQAAAHMRNGAFKSSGQRLIAPNERVDAAKLWYCSTVGYSDQKRACASCWLREGCSLRPRTYAAPVIERAATQVLGKPTRAAKVKVVRVAGKPRASRFAPLAEGSEYDLKFGSDE
jgi:site-specific DNA-cytosine methylase/very-short-patch-repair endonuclease